MESTRLPRFCRDCGAAIGRLGQRFCDSCGAELEYQAARGVTSRHMTHPSDDSAAPGDSLPALRATAPASTAISILASRSGVSSPDLSSAAVVLAAPVLAWLILTTVVTGVAAVIVGDVTKFINVASLPLFGPIASMLAGFGYTISASVGTSIYSAASGSASLSGAPIFSLLIIGAAAAVGGRHFGARRAAGALPLSSWCILTAGLGTIAMWLIAMASAVTLSADLGKWAGVLGGAVGYSGVGSVLESLGIGVSVQGTPGMLGALPLFGVLLLGVGVGTGWLEPRILLAPQGRYAALIAGLGVYLVELAAISVLTLLAWIVFFLINGAQIRGDVIPLLATVFAVPSAVLMVGATLAGAGFGMGEDYGRSSLLVTDLPPIMLLAALVLVAVAAIAGGMWMARVSGSGRAALARSATHAQVLTVALVSQGLLLAGGFLASFSVASSETEVTGLSDTATFGIGSSFSPLIAGLTLLMVSGLLTGIAVRESARPFARQASARTVARWREVRARGLRATLSGVVLSYNGMPRPAQGDGAGAPGHRDHRLPGHLHGQLHGLPPAAHHRGPGEPPGQ